MIKIQLRNIVRLTAGVLFVLVFASCQERIWDNPYDPKSENFQQDEEDQDEEDIEFGSMTDKENNTYKTVIIGTQTWMAENLKTTKYNDGTSIPNVTENTDWINLTSGAYCWLNNDINNKSTYGALYNWYAVNTGKLCPEGWHVPSDAEWTTLTNYLGGEGVAGGKMKSTTGWDSPNTGATNSSGFSGLPGGYRDTNGDFGSIGDGGYWWSATESSSYNAWNRYLHYYGTTVYRRDDNSGNGFSVRCVRD